MMNAHYIDVLNQKILPVLAGHGGYAKILEIKDDVMTISLYGACAGCPSADLETKNFIENIFREECPEIQQVEIYHPVEEELLAYARDILNHSKSEQRA